MAIGRTFNEPSKKAFKTWKPVVLVGVVTELRNCTSGDSPQRTPNANFRRPSCHAAGMSVEEVYELTGIDPWFLDKMQQLLETEKFLKHAVETVDKRATACSEK